MKRILLMVMSSLVTVMAISQEKDHVKWEYTYRPLAGKTGEIQIVATIEHPWHIYAQVQPKEAVASPTKIVFAKNPMVTLVGKPEERGKKETYYNKEVDIKQYQYGDKVEFVQKVTLKAKLKTNITGSISYQVCDNERCLPVKTIPFTVSTQ